MKRYLFFLTILIISCSDDNGSTVAKTEIQFQTSSSVAIEDSSNTIRIPISVSGSLDSDISMQYEVSGTAELNADVTLVTETNFTIPKETDIYYIEMVVNEDDVNEFDDETLNIKLIGNDNVIIGDNSTHEITITADDLTSVSFLIEKNESVFGRNVPTYITLSEPLDKDLTIRVDAEIHDQDDSGDYYFNNLPADVTFPAGTTFLTFDLVYNTNYGDTSIDDEVVRLKILGVVQDGTVGWSTGVALDPVLSTPVHAVDIVYQDLSQNLRYEISWTSPDDNVDLYLGLADEDSLFALDISDQTGKDVTEFVNLAGLPNGKYYLYVGWTSGTGTAEITSKITPTGSVKLQGSSSTITKFFVDISETSLETVGNVIDVIIKEGNNYTFE